MRILNPTTNALVDERPSESFDMFHPASQGSTLVPAKRNSTFTIAAGGAASAVGGGRGSPDVPHGSCGSRRDSGSDADDAAASELKCMYPPSEASVVWSLVTAEGAEFGNFSSATSRCYYYFNDGDDKEALRHTAAGAKSNRPRSSRSRINGGSLLMGCISKSAVDAIGPPRTCAHRPEVEPATVARVCGLDVTRRRWVMLYNPYLLRMFNCHINVEVCSSIKAVNYLYKYVYKGHDRTSFSLDQPDSDGNIDEIKRYVDARWVTPSEALWRIYGFELSENFPLVLQLPRHVPNMHRVSSRAGEDLNDVAARDSALKSMLTEYFEANKEHEWARTVLYKDFLGKFTWQAGKMFWKCREQRYQVGRIMPTHPAEEERYYLRVLLNHVPGSTSFEDLRTVDGVLCSSFREAAERSGLIEADNTLEECLTEAELFQMPSSLQRLFATILVFCEPSDVHGLWDRHLEAMSDDYRRSHMCLYTVEQMVLLDIRNMLQSMGKEITSFPLPDIDKTHDTTSGEAREVTEESTIEVDIEHVSLASSLNPEQRSAYDEILAAVDNGDGGVFFIDGPGGTEKTFLYKALLATVRSEGKIAVAIATSGVAASIMPGGRTVHPRFKIPLNIEDGSSCSFTKQSGTAKLLRMASLIIWDEATMTKRQEVEALESSMRDVMGRRDRPFRGKTVVFGSDYRQVLPVVRGRGLK